MGTCICLFCNGPDTELCIECSAKMTDDALNDTTAPREWYEAHGVGIKAPSPAPAIVAAEERGKARGAAEERARIVAIIRATTFGHGNQHGWVVLALIDAIERGAHLTPPTDTPQSPPGTPGD